VIDTILTDVDAELKAIGNGVDLPVHYRHITLDEVEEAGHKEQGQGKLFWQDRY
jgi:hypothetical protein